MDNRVTSMAANMTGQAPNNQIAQFREFMQMFNVISEQCFMDCIKNFTSKQVSKEEYDCSISCLTKHLQSTQRISGRFQEEFIEQQKL